MISKILIFWTINIIIILGCIYISFTLVNNKRKKEKKPPFSLIRLLNNDQPLTVKNLLVGMSFGIVFGLSLIHI